MEQNKPRFFGHIRQLMAADEIPEALRQLRSLLGNSPRLNEAIQQSARYQDICRQLRLGTVGLEDATLIKNQIRWGLLELLDNMQRQGDFRGLSTLLTEMELTAGKPVVGEELERAIRIVSSKNVVLGKIWAGGNVTIGDTTIINNQSADFRIPHALTPPPFLSEVFLGRANDLRRIHEQLFAPEGNLLLLVNGEGGVGKTSVASRYFHQYQHEYTHVAWVFSEKSIADALLLLALPLGLKFDERMNAEQRLDALFAAMINLRKPCLLVLDNVNEPTDLQAHYQRLRSCSNFHLLLTTRITEFEKAASYRIEHLKKKEAFSLFKTHYPNHQKKEDQILEEIMAAVDYNTLVIELLAKNLRNFNRIKAQYSLDNLLKDLQDKNLLALSHSKTVKTGYQSKGAALREEKPEDIIAAMYDLSELSEAETPILSIFAVLPAENIAFEVLSNLISDIENLDELLLSIAQKGWIDYNEMSATFKASPVIQEITKRKHGQLLDDCKRLFDSLIDKLDYEAGTGHFTNATYEEAATYARYAENVINSFEQPDANLAILCERLGSYHQTTGNLDKALAFYEDETELFKELYEAYPQNVSFKNGLAISFWKLGDFNRKAENKTEARAYFQEAERLWAELVSSFPSYPLFKKYLDVARKDLENL